MHGVEDRAAGVLLGIAAGDRVGGPVRMALRVAESLRGRGGFDASDVASRYLAWWRDGAFDTGSAPTRLRPVERSTGRGSGRGGPAEPACPDCGVGSAVALPVLAREIEASRYGSPTARAHTARSPPAAQTPAAGSTRPLSAGTECPRCAVACRWNRCSPYSPACGRLRGATNPDTFPEQLQPQRFRFTARPGHGRLPDTSEQGR